MNNGRSPIAKLHRDLLSQIFSINAVHGLYRIRPESSPLTTARHTSQVCASWRQLIISSPSLWGDMIDLPFLQQKSDAWRNEVLLRFGNSELLIFGHIGDGREYAKKFLELLLENHWTRIQQVNVGFYGFYGAEWPNNAWSALGRPAPNLRFFSVTFQGGLLGSRISPGFTLFNNHAPLLTHFQQSGIPMNIEEASWISGLISLTLDLASNFTIPQVLAACSQMRSLQTLHLNFEKFEGPSLEGVLRYVNIPSLSNLFVDCPFDASLAFLEHIKPAPGCILRLRTQGRNLKWKTPPEFVVFQLIVAKFADNYFCHRNPAKSFHLIFTNEAIEFGDVRGFVVSIRHFNTIPTSLLVLLLGAFEPTYISGVKTLHLCGDLSALLLTNFFAPVTSLEKLNVTTGALIYFINLMDGVNEQHSFPHLKTLKWLSQPDIDLSHDGTSLIMNFLTTRRNLGLPIEIFDFTNWDAMSDVPMDVRALEGIPGLKVVWDEDGRKEYICGSGRPQELYWISSYDRDMLEHMDVFLGISRSTA